MEIDEIRDVLRLTGDDVPDDDEAFMEEAEEEEMPADNLSSGKGPDDMLDLEDL